MRKLVKYLKKYKKNVILGPIFKLTEAVFELIVPLVMAQIIDVGIANKDSGYIWQMGGVLVWSGICTDMSVHGIGRFSGLRYGAQTRAVSSHQYSFAQGS